MDCSKFGRPVVPSIYDDKLHKGLHLTIYHDCIIVRESNFLRHQIYLHDLVLELWKAEKKEVKIQIFITCIRISDEKVELT